MEIINKVQYDTFYHEHLRTYSLISLDKLFSMYDLTLFDAQIVTRYEVVSDALYLALKKIKLLDLMI